MIAHGVTRTELYGYLLPLQNALGPNRAICYRNFGSDPSMAKVLFCTGPRTLSAWTMLMSFLQGPLIRDRGQAGRWPGHDGAARPGRAATKIAWLLAVATVSTDS